MGTLSPRDLALVALRILADIRLASVIHNAMGNDACEPEVRASCQRMLADALAHPGPEAEALKLAVSIASGKDVHLVEMLNTDYAPQPGAGDDARARTIH